MDREQIIKNAELFVKNILENDSTGHDWWHAYRVLQTSRTIAQDEGGDLLIIELAALLHDVDDWKITDIKPGDERSNTMRFLKSQDLASDLVNHVVEIVSNISFKGARVETPMMSKEGMIVQDADRLDAIGAIGIARAFSYGGAKGRSIFDPSIKPVQHESFSAYKTSVGTTINHFYEKLLLLKDNINTNSGLRIAESRHKFIEEYLEQFFREWHGKK